jgi:hypothetical protein
MPVCAIPNGATVQDAPLPLHVSVKETMGGVVAFSAHVVDRMRETPEAMTDSDWQAIRLAAQNLNSSATVLTVRGDSPLDTLRKIDPDWRKMTAELQNTAETVATAAANRDTAALSKAATEMREACRTCHTRYGVHGE